MKKTDKHIAIFLPSLDGGGGERVMVNLSKAFAMMCPAVDMVLVNAKGSFLSEVPDSVRVVDLSSKSTSHSIFKLIDYLNQSSPDIMISTLNSANVVALLAKKLSKNTRTKFYIREANTPSKHLGGYHSVKSRCLNTLVKRLYPHADRIIAVSAGVAADLRTYLNRPEIDIDVIYNPVNVPDREGMAAAVDVHEWLSDRQGPVILGVGRLEKQKNFELLIRAFCLVREQCEARLIILGKGSLKSELETLSKHLGLVEHVSIAGFHNNPYLFMAYADLFVLSSLWEGFPNTLLEALACGCPVVSTDCPSGPAEILQDGEFGTLVPVDDVAKLASAIISALSCEPDRTRLIGRAQNFSLEETAKKYLGP